MSNPHEWLIPSAPSPIGTTASLEGYLQISLTPEGEITVRGTRLLLEWLLQNLAEEGWQIQLESVRWCG